jgi:hypothetical protein
MTTTSAVVFAQVATGGGSVSISVAAVVGILATAVLGLIAGLAARVFGSVRDEIKGVRTDLKDHASKDDTAQAEIGKRIAHLERSVAKIEGRLGGD